MKLHANAALTIKQRRQVKQLFDNDKLPIVEIARRFSVSPQTVRRWSGRSDFRDRQVTRRTPRIVTPEYEQAVIDYRRQHPAHGAIRVALALQADFPFANRGTVAIILKRSGLTEKGKPRVRTNWKIPVGRHRLQCDVQELPAIKGQKGFEYTHQLYSSENPLSSIRRFISIARPKRWRQSISEPWIICPLFHNFHR